MTPKNRLLSDGNSDAHLVTLGSGRFAPNRIRRLGPWSTFRQVDRLESALLLLADSGRFDSRGESTSETQPTRTMPSERRSFPRRTSGGRVLVAKIDSDAAAVRNPQQLEWLLHATRQRGELIEISRGGLVFLLDEPPACGEFVALRLRNEILDHDVDVVAQVLRSGESDGRWKVVGRLLEPLAFDEVHRIGRGLFTSEIV